MYGYSHMRFRYLCFDDLNREPNKNMKTDKTCRSLNFLFGCRIHNSNNGFKIFNCTFYFEVITLSKINTLYCSLRKIKWRVGFVFLWYNSSFQRYLLYKYRLPVVNLIPTIVFVEYSSQNLKSGIKSDYLRSILLTKSWNASTDATQWYISKTEFWIFVKVLINNSYCK